MLNINEATEKLNVTYQTVYTWIKANKIRATKIGKAWYFEGKEIERVKNLFDRGCRLPVIPGIVDLSKVDISEVEREGSHRPAETSQVGPNLDKRMEAKKIVLELSSTIGQVDDNWGVKTKILKAIDFINREYKI